jgi:hypothetical protein
MRCQTCKYEDRGSEVAPCANCRIVTGEARGVSSWAPRSPKRCSICGETPSVLVESPIADARICPLCVCQAAEVLAEAAPVSAPPIPQRVIRMVRRG